MPQSRCPFALSADLEVGHCSPVHGHPFTEVVYCERCVGDLMQGDRRFMYRDRSIIVYQPGVDHWVENKVPGQQICLGIVGFGSESIPAGIWEANDRLVQWFTYAGDLLQTGTGFQQERLDCLVGLIALELREQSPKTSWKTKSRAARAKSLIDESFWESWSVKDLAAKIFVSPDYLRQLFRKEYGESIIHYLIRKRMEHAAHMLRSSDLPVKTIAERCGFHDPYHFSRTFKQIIGMSPTAYRQTS